MKINLNLTTLKNNFVKQKPKTIKPKEKHEVQSSLECLAVYNQISFKNKPMPLYAMDYYGRTKRFDSIVQASEMLGCSQAHIIKVLKGELHLANGLALSYASDLENKDKSLNEAKLKELSKKFSSGLNLPIYMVDYSGKVTRFKNSAQAKEELGIEQIYTNGEKKSSNGLFFINANELDLRRDNGKVILDIFGNPEIDYKKLYKILIEMSGRPSKPLYLIDKNKNAVRFNSAKEITQKVGISSGDISKCLNGDILHVKGYVIVNAFDIELRDEKCRIMTDKKGAPLIDKQKVADYATLLDVKRKQAVSFKNIETGEVLEFESKMKAAEFFGITRQRLDSVLKTKTEFKGYYILE